MSKPFVLVELGGRPRKLRFDANSLVALEEVLNRPVQEIFPGEEGKAARLVGLREMRAGLWAALLHEEPGLTLKAAGELLELERLGAIVGKVTEALGQAFPSAAPEEPEKNAGAPAAAGTGEPS